MNNRIVGALLVAALAIGCGGATTDTSGAGGARAAGGTAGTASGGTNAGGATAAGSGGATAGGAGGTTSGGTAGAGGCESFVPCCDAAGHSVAHQCMNGFPVCPPGSSFPPSGICQPPAQTSTCGPITCVQPGRYCERQASDVAGVPDTFTCKQTPPDCPQADLCACLKSEPCGASCSTDTSGYATLVCPGG